MTKYQAKSTESVLKSYQIKALLSILTGEQKQQYNAYIQERLPDLKAELGKILAPHEAEDIVD